MKLFNSLCKSKRTNFISVVNAIALILAVNSVNTACVWIMHQPEVPEEMKEYKK